MLVTEMALAGFELQKALSDRHVLAADLLGLKIEGGTQDRSFNLAQLVETSSEARRTVIGVAIVLAAYEADTGVHTWRRPTPGARRYFGILSAWGYQLSDVEQVIVGDVKAVASEEVR